MRILHLSRNFYPCIGGTEIYIYDISKRLIQRDIACRVLSLNYHIFNKKRKFPKFEIIDGIEAYHIPGFGHYKKPIPLKIPLHLFRWADIVHVHDLRLFYETTLALKPLYKYRTCLSTHGFILHTAEAKFIKSILIPLYYKTTIEKCIDAVICDSQQDLEYFSRWKPKKIELIENGIDFEKYNKIEIRPSKKKLLFFGRIDNNKGVDLLLHTLAKIKDLDWSMHIIGSGIPSYVDNLKSLALSLGLSSKITWHGYLQEEKVFEHLSTSSLCLFPSRYEGFGYTLFEAMAAGAVCLVNTIKAYMEVISDNKNGFLVDFFDPSVGAAKIEHILSLSHDHLLQIRREAKAKAKEYDWENKIDQIIDVYSSIRNV
jgi:alpha-1,3-mannosyltransferase